MKKQSASARMDESLGMRRGKESTKKQSYKSRRDESVGSMKKKTTESMPPSKKVNMKGGKEVPGYKFASVKEKEEYLQAWQDNHPRSKPADVAQALMKAKEGYSKKVRVKPSRVKGK